MAVKKSSLTTDVPKPKMQGGHGSSDATTQKTKIQSKSGPVGTGKSNILYTKQPSGTKGVGTTAGKPRS
mgnify:CR=1 FL=1